MISLENIHTDTQICIRTRRNNFFKTVFLFPSCFFCDFIGTLEFTRVVSHLFTGSLAGIGKLPALAWYIWYGMYGIFCTVRFGGSSIL